MKTLLKVNNLRISFCRDDKWQEAVHGIDFEVFEGKTLGIVGESGSGKSVSNLAVMQLLDRRKSRIESDSIMLEDEDISHLNDDAMSEIRGKKIAMIFQDPMSSLNPIMRIGKQITEAMLLKNKANRKEGRVTFNKKLNTLSTIMTEALAQGADATVTVEEIANYIPMENGNYT